MKDYLLKKKKLYAFILILIITGFLSSNIFKILSQKEIDFIFKMVYNR